MIPRGFVSSSGGGGSANSITVKSYDKGTRYLRLTSNKNTNNSGNHLAELEVYDGNTNIMSNITLNENNCYVDTTLSNITNPGFTVYRERYNDGNKSTFSGTGDGLSVFIFDLGAIHNVDRVKIWRYYRDGRTYHDTKIELSKDGVHWHTISDGIDYVETSAGKEWTNTGTEVFTTHVLTEYIDARIAAAFSSRGL